MKTVLLLLLLALTSLASGPKIVAVPAQSPLVTFRLVFETGAAHDPPDKTGTAALTALMLAGGGSRELTYKQVVDRLYPTAGRVSVQIDKEMVTFSGSTNVDNLETYYGVLRQMLLQPGWRADDLSRLRNKLVAHLRVGLRGNDEELAKEVLYNAAYQGHPYGHANEGTVAALGKIAIDDLQNFYGRHFTQANLTIGVAGGYPPGFAERVAKDFSVLPDRAAPRKTHTAPEPPQESKVTLIAKNTRSVAYSLGFPISVRRGHPDYVVLLLAQAYFGQHRDSNGRLFQRMRESRGLNYGDYAYIEYFPNGMFAHQPSPNLARQHQMFQIWIRPVEPQNAHFALRLAIYELQRLVEQGLSAADFETTRSFLRKHVRLLMPTKDAELGYAIDSRFYGIPDYREYVQKELATLTVDRVNAVIRKHLGGQPLQVVAVTSSAETLRGTLLADGESPIVYNSPKPADVLAEDKVVAALKLGLKPENVRVVKLESVFE